MSASVAAGARRRCRSSGVGNAVGFVAFSTLLQRRTSGPLIGRVSAASDVAIGGAQTASMATGATLIAFVDFRVMFAVIAVTLLVCAATLAWTSRHDPVEQPDPAATAPSRQRW